MARRSPAVTARHSNATQRLQSAGAAALAAAAAAVRGPPLTRTQSAGARERLVKVLRLLLRRCCGRGRLPKQCAAGARTQSAGARRRARVVARRGASGLVMVLRCCCAAAALLLRPWKTAKSMCCWRANEERRSAAARARGSPARRERPGDGAALLLRCCYGRGRLPKQCAAGDGGLRVLLRWCCLGGWRLRRLLLRCSCCWCG